MTNFWTQIKKYSKFRQFATVVLILGSGLSEAAVKRAPASYIPDDDVIVRPVANEISFYHQYVASDDSKDVVKSRNQFKIWHDNQQFADQYGLSTKLHGSHLFVPSEEEKFEYFKDKYMRYLRRKGEQPFKDMPKEWYQDYRAANEVDTIDEMEERFKKSNSQKVASGEKKLPKALREKEVSIWKKNKFIFQPRVDQGLVIVGIKGPLVDARAWVGVNGETEINVKKEIDSIGFRVMFNYYAHTGEYLTSADQRIVENVYARVISLNDPEKNLQNNTIMLRYAKQF